MNEDFNLDIASFSNCARKNARGELLPLFRILPTTRIVRKATRVRIRLRMYIDYVLLQT